MGDGASRTPKDACDLGASPFHLLPPPTLGTRCHGSLAPMPPLWAWDAGLRAPQDRRPTHSYAEEAADDSAVCKHVEIVIAAMAGTSGLPTRVSRYAPQSFRCASKK